MTESDLNEGLAKIIDSEKTAINTKQGSLTLRNILTAVYNAQERDTHWFSKLFGKKLVIPGEIILYLPDRVSNYINNSQGGHYLGFYKQLIDSLNLLAELGFLLMREDDILDVGLDVIHQYGVTSFGKAFVNYNENKET